MLAEGDFILEGAVDQVPNLTEQPNIEDMQQAPQTLVEKDSDEVICMEEKISEENMWEPLTLARIASDRNSANPQGIHGVYNKNLRLD